jgi:predicted permease
MVSPGYLETLGVKLVRGRLISQQDRADSTPVAVVTEELARQAWPGQDPLGRRLRRGRAGDERFPWRTVVGVVGDVKEDRINFRIDRPALYLPHAQDGYIAVEIPLNLAIRTDGDPTAVASAIRQAVRDLDSEQPIENVRTVKEHLAGVLTTERFGAALAGTLAPLGLALAALGLYAVMAYSVAQRTTEIGIRMALGAGPRSVLGLFLRRGIALAAIGVAIGLSGARALATLLSGSLYGVGPTDLRTFGVAAAVLSVIAVAACLLPARRATRVDPIAALRGGA